MPRATAGKRSGCYRLVVCLVVSTVALTVVQPAVAGWARWGAAGVGVVGVANALKKNLLGRGLNLLDEGMGAVIEGDDEKARGIWEKADQLPGHLVKDAIPIFSVTDWIGKKFDNAGKRLKRIAERAKNFVGQAGEVAVDARIALAPSPKRKAGGAVGQIFDSKPLPQVNVSSGSRSTARSPWEQSKAGSKQEESFSLEKWAESERRARPDCYGVISDTKAAECEQDPWAAKPKEEKPGTSKAAQERVKRGSRGVDESQNEYAKALADTLGDKRKEMSTDGDYMGALDALERNRIEADRRNADVGERVARLEDQRSGSGSLSGSSIPSSSTPASGSVSRSGPVRASTDMAGYCKRPDPRVFAAMEQITARAKGTAGAYCGAVNIARAMTWKLLNCMKDSTLSASERAQVEIQIRETRKDASQNLKGYHAVTVRGSSCECWTDVCAD